MAPPIVVGVWSMAFLLRQHVEHYYIAHSMIQCNASWWPHLGRVMLIGGLMLYLDNAGWWPDLSLTLLLQGYTSTQYNINVHSTIKASG